MKFEKKLFIAVLLAKLIILSIFIVWFGPDRIVWSDSTAYIGIGKNIIDGNGFSPALGGDAITYTPNTIRTPLYPFIIGIFTVFSGGLVALSILQAIVASVSAVLVYLIAKKFVSHIYAIVAVVLATFEPLIAVIHLLILPETFLVLFLLLFVYYFLRHLEEGNMRFLLLSSVFLALAVYTKPVAYYLFAVPIIILLFQRARAKNIAAFAIILFVLFAPWMARNKIAVDQFVMTTDDQGNICGWELSGIIATKYRMDSSDFTKLYAHPEYQKAHARCTSTLSAIKLFLSDYPKEFFVTSALSAASMLTNEGYGAFFERPAYEQIKIHHNYLTPAVFTNADWPERLRAAAGEIGKIELGVVILGKIFWATIMLLSLVSIKLFVSKRSLPALFVGLFIVYFLVATVITTGFGVGARLRFPIDSLLVIFALASIQQLISKYNGRIKIF